MNKLLYGVAYYDEYMPYDRLAKDVEMMKTAGINQCGSQSPPGVPANRRRVFDFSHVIRVLDAMEEAGINVIIGTPTYAVPTWMVKSLSGCTCRDCQRQRHLRCASDHGHHTSGLSLLCGTRDP